MESRRYTSLLLKYNIKLTLVDVGASLEPHPPFQPLLKFANYIGFDPDLREIRKLRSKAFHNYIMMNKAVVPEASTAKTTFFLTRNPTCSSNLKPNQNLCKHYIYSYRFEVVDEVTVHSITLDNTIAELHLDCIDWLKLDTQGTDLRIINGLSDKLAKGLLVVDVEPGFDQFYDGEDTFVMIHSEMLKRGFWLADISTITAARLSRQVFFKYFSPKNKLSRYLYEFSLKQSPIAVGARYLRTLESLRALDGSRITYLKLWACSFFSGNYSYALQSIDDCIQRFGLDQTLDRLLHVTKARLRYSVWLSSWRVYRKIKWRNILRFLKKSY